MDIKIPEYVGVLMERLAAAGEECYVVGGGLRDTLLGSAPNDYDLTTSATPERMCEIFSDYRTVESGLKHGTLTVISEHRAVEITTFRIDGSYTDSRHPDEVRFTRSIGEDLARRDFTVNAMAWGSERGLVDLYGGREDLERKIIRAVGDPAKRFEEDALRILRAFRFSAQLGLSIESGTLSAAGAKREGLSHIAKERICTEFLKLICSPTPTKPLAQMRELGIIDYVIGSYRPSAELIELLPKMQSDDVARLGFLLVDASEEQAREILCSLKCSNRQKSGAMAVAGSARRAVLNARDAARLCSALRENAPFAARASMLLGFSNGDAVSLVENNRAPRSIAELAIGGEELIALGIGGREIGKTLAQLLDAALDDPDVNQKERLIDMVKEKYIGKGE
jgi:tRNA nucleotidyltransferase (CCA-adding enzyme)